MKKQKDLTLDEFRRFLESLRSICLGTKTEAVYYIASMQYAIFGRVQEAAALHFEDFNLERKTILIRRKIQWARSKGFEDKIVDGAKANSGKELELTDFAARIFKEWIMRSGIRSGLLFQYDGKHLSYRQIEYRYTQALKKVGLPFSATHLLRHASLCEFYDTTKDLLATQKVAGQKDLRSTMCYAKIRDERSRELQRKMDEKLSSVFQ